MVDVLISQRQKSTSQRGRSYSLKVYKSKLYFNQQLAQERGGSEVLNITSGLDETEGLNISFDVSKTSDIKNTEGNSASIEVYNMSRQQIAQLESGKDLYVVFSVRYATSTEDLTLFQGTIKQVNSRKTGTEFVTQILVGDGYTSLTTEKLKGFVPPGATVEEVLDQIVKSIPNVSRGTFIGTNLNTRVVSGWRISGDAKTVLRKFCEAQRLEYTIDNGVLSVTDINMPTSADVVLAPIIDANTGMIDTPFWETEGAAKAIKDKRARRRLHVAALINPAITPASLVVVDYLGDYVPVRVTEVRYTGEFRGNTWQMELVCTEVTSEDFMQVSKIKGKSNQTAQVDYSQDNTIQ